LFCAKLQPWKRPLDLVQAFAKADVANSLLLLAGDGPLKEELQAETARLGISDRVRFLGFVNQTQLPALYTAADVMVLPSEYDAFGVVVNEAILCGCPVIASNSVGAGRDLIAPIDPSFIYPCGDVETLSSLLRRILSDRSYLAKFQIAAGERMKTWSPREYIDATVDAVERAVSRIRPTS
jgi:glycosyltransferase involved in cell wall biosynthesis